MKKIMALVLVTVLLALTGCVTRLETDEASDAARLWEQMAERLNEDVLAVRDVYVTEQGGAGLLFVVLIASGEYEAAFGMLDESVPEHVTDATFLEMVWSDAAADLGKLLDVVDYSEVTVPSFDGYIVSVTFSHENPELFSIHQISVNEQSAIMGWNFAPVADLDVTPPQVHDEAGDELQEEARAMTYETEHGAAALLFNHFIVTGDYEAAFDMFDVSVLEVLPVADASFIEVVWGDIAGALGEPLEFADISQEELPHSAGRLVSIVIAHENPEFFSISRIVVSHELTIIGWGYEFMPNPNFSPLYGQFIEEPIVVGADGDYPLPGLLTLPVNAEGPVPAVVIVHGSGLVDMHGTVGAQAPYRDIAQSLAARGIASIRYDKRTLTHNAAMLRSIEYFQSLTVDWETIEDAILAKDVLIADPRIDSRRIYVIGHSLGGMLAPEIAHRGDFAGFIIMAGSFRSLTALALEQIEHLFEGMPLDIAREQHDEFQSAHGMFLSALHMTEEEQKNTFILGMTAFYLIDLYNRVYPPEFLLSRERPGLILHGGMDYQTRADIDFEAYLRVTEDMDNITAILYPNLTHLFAVSHSDGELGTNLDYFLPERVDEAVIEDIAAFILD